MSAPRRCQRSYPNEGRIFTVVIVRRDCGLAFSETRLAARNRSRLHVFSEEYPKATTAGKAKLDRSLHSGE